VLLRATAGRWPGYRFDPHLGWDPVAAGGLAVHDVPSDHDGMLKSPGVQAVAETLRSYLVIR
jgi:thioesterase domain-containing protein